MKSDPAWALAVATLSAFGATACGGATFTSGGGDASAPVDDGGADGSSDATRSEASPPFEASAVDVAVSCVTGSGHGGGGSGTCTRGQDFTCGTTTYNIDCFCPSSTCDCKRDGVTVKSIPYAGCPGCNGDPIDLAAACDFPAP